MSVRILNTWGGYTAKDATAEASDVLSGKVFYNSRGKQTGSYIPSAKMIKTIILPSPSGAVTEDYTLNDPSSYEIYNQYRVEPRDIWARTYPKYCQVIEGIDRIIAMSINGNYHYCPSVPMSSATTYNYDDEICFYHRNKCIYIGAENNFLNENQVMLYYMDE